MSENTFAVAFSGQLVEGADPARVRANLAQLFKLDPTKVEHLFSGKRVVIKKGVDQQTAEKYKLALHKAGAVVAIINLAAANTSVQKPAAATASPVATQQQSSLEQPSSQAVQATSAVMDNVTMAEPGVVLVAAEEVPELQVDVSGMDMAEPGVVLAPAEEVAELQLDLSGLDMAEPGVVLVAAEEAPELQVDVSGMDMAEPGVVLVQAEEVPEPVIDISSLSVDEPEPDKPKNPFM